MTRVLFVGQQPETVDFSDPAIPAGFDAAGIQAGIDLALKQMTERGWQADPCMAPPDAAAGPMVAKQLASAPIRVVLGRSSAPDHQRDYDCSNLPASAAALAALRRRLHNDRVFGQRSGG